MTTLSSRLFIHFTLLLPAACLFSGGFWTTDVPASAGQDGTGEISGKIEIRAMQPLIRIERGGRYRSGAAPEAAQAPGDEANEIRNVVVYLEGESLANAPSPARPKAVMDQMHERFVPHVLAIRKGSSVDFVNHDKVYHNVFSLSSPRRFNIGRRPTGEEVPIDFDKSGVVQLFCDIHSQMSAFIVILDNSFYAQPDAEGVFRIEHVPEGTYTLKVWHERLGAAEQKITITAGRTARANFVLE